MAGVISGHAQAATLACIGFYVIDRLHLQPHGSEKAISIVMMSGAAGTLAAQWGLIPRLRLGPRALILWGSIIASAGMAVTMADFEKALTETRASVTEEMLNDYARIQETLKSDAVRPTGGIGFVLPGMLRPRGPGKGSGGNGEPPASP